MLSIREDIPSNILTKDKEPIESLHVELNLLNENHLINCSFNPHKTLIIKHLATWSNFLDLYSSTYAKMLILGDFNVGIDEPHLKPFCETYNLTNLIKKPTCFKSPDNSTCILPTFHLHFKALVWLRQGYKIFIWWHWRCEKGVQIWSFFLPVFPRIRKNNISTTTMFNRFCKYWHIK